jgi:hypothetical protein
MAGPGGLEPQPRAQNIAIGLTGDSVAFGSANGLTVTGFSKARAKGGPER